MTDSKVCARCKQERSRDAFYKRKDGKGWSSTCKPCTSARAKENQRAHPRRTAIYRAIYKARHPEKHQRYRREHFRRERHKMLVAYGHACTCCGETRAEFLGVDHINGDGKQHRAEMGNINVSVWLRRHGYPKDRFQLLCHNCNLAKGFYDECPHVRERTARAA